MVVLQAWDEAGGVAKLASVIKFLVQNSGLVKKAGVGAGGSGSGSGSLSEEQQKQVAKQIAHFLAMGKRLLTTSLTVLDRAGQPVASSGFDEKLFASTLKSQLFEAMSSLWTEVRACLLVGTPRTRLCWFCFVLFCFGGVLFCFGDVASMRAPRSRDAGLPASDCRAVRLQT